MSRGRVRILRLVALAAMAVSLCLAPASEAKKRRRKVRRQSVATFPAEWASAPSARYAALSGAACRTALGDRGIAFTSVGKARGVLAPVRIIDGVGGVLYRTLLPREKRLENAHDLFDCRLVLALHDFSAILKRHDIDVALIYSAWRPPSKRWPADRLGRRHPGALAVDIFRFGKRLEEGETKRQWLDVIKDFGGQIGAPSCGTKAPPLKPSTARWRTESDLLRGCRSAALQLDAQSQLQPRPLQPLAPGDHPEGQVAHRALTTAHASPTPDIPTANQRMVEISSR